MNTQKLAKLYDRAITGLCWVIPSAWLRARIPVSELIRPLNRTPRLFYEKERQVYRLTYFLVRKGTPIDRRAYHIHKAIAQKYGWPYVKEVYDDQ